jgi:small redox-active disulfide protein 2
MPPRHQGTKVSPITIKLNTMEIKILGTGCAKCKTLEKLTREVVSKNNISATITKVEDIVEIMKYNIMTTPALVIDEKVVTKGRIPSSDEILKLLTT